MERSCSVGITAKCKDGTGVGANGFGDSPATALSHAQGLLKVACELKGGLDPNSFVVGNVVCSDDALPDQTECE
jgi:hypothetical protein